MKGLKKITHCVSYNGVHLLRFEPGAFRSLVGMHSGNHLLGRRELYVSKTLRWILK